MDRDAWTAAVISDSLRWGFEGIQKPAVRRYGQNKSNGNLLDVLLDDKQFVDQLQSDEAAAYLEPDYDEDWREACAERLDKQGWEPHEEGYDEHLLKAFHDKDDRSMWADGRLEWDWTYQLLKDWCEDKGWVFYFLKEHPVEYVASRGYDGDIIELCNVAGYCFGCGEPQLHGDVKQLENATEVAAHTGDCDGSVCDNEIGYCAFNEEGQRRSYYDCHYCGETNTIDNGVDRRPFHWPPGAPWPSRTTFFGTPADVQPWEE